jgi:hypothetical protein
MQCAFEVAPVDLGRDLREVSRLNAERDALVQRWHDLDQERDDTAWRQEEVEDRLHAIFQPIADREAAATNRVVREEDYRTVAASVPELDQLHLQWAVSTRERTRRVASNDRHRVLVTAELEQWLHYTERYDYGHLGRHDELCHLPRAFDLIDTHYLARLRVLERNDERAREEMQGLNQQLERGVAQRAAQDAARMATTAAAAVGELTDEVVTRVATRHDDRHEAQGTRYPPSL